MAAMKILILSTKFGEGHYQAGEALLQAIQKQYPHQIEVTHLDFGLFFFEKTDRMLRQAYGALLRKGVKGWAWLYEKTFFKRSELVFQQLPPVLYSRLNQYLHTFRPDLIVATHFFPAGILAVLKRKGKLHTPLATVVTDYLVHSIWLHQGVDAYLVANREVCGKLLQRGLEPHQVQITGIPIRPMFSESKDKADCRRRLHLAEGRFTILVMGGLCGGEGKEVEMVKALFETTQDQPIQILVACGEDSPSYSMIRRKAEQENAPPVHLFGYVEQIDELMRAADLLVTKGGALTISEALSLGLPVLMYKPIPGHESGNVAFVEKAGAGLQASSPEELSILIKSLIRNKARLKEMGEAGRKLLPSGSARQGVQALLKIAREG